MSNFQLVSFMNEAFGNRKGDPQNIDLNRVRNQSKNIFDEFCELMVALGANKARIQEAKETFLKQIVFDSKFETDIDKARDAFCDINVFSYGGHHLMGIDADRDMQSVINAVMSRFIKDPEDLKATVAKHAAKGVTFVYFEGDYPTMIMKSGDDQPDAPRGKFLKSASCVDPVFYDPVVKKEAQQGTGLTGAFNPLPFDIQGNNMPSPDNAK